MEMDQQIFDLGIRLTEVAARNGAAMITDRVRGLRASGKQEDTIAGLEQLVSDLIADKQELTRIAQSYQQELVAQRLNSGDVKYIADTVVPLLEELATAQGGEKAEENLAMIEKLKPILSVELVNVMQLLGFNFRRAVGEPLTDLVAHLITARVNQSTDLQVENLKNQRAIAELALDPDAYERFVALYRR